MSHTSSSSISTLHAPVPIQKRNETPSITVSPFDDPPNDTYDDMSSLPNNLERPTIGHGRNSSFRTRALAVAAAHRLTHSPENEPRSPTLLPNGDGNTHEDIEAEAGTSPTSRISNLMSPGGTKPRYRWLSSTGGGGTGDEPGVDVRSRRDEDSYGHLDGRTQISVVDWTNETDDESKNVRIDFPGERLREWLETDAKSRRVHGDTGGVRWIHVDGLNWEVIKTLTLKYGLHPLAVEDALRSSNSPRSKLDFYRNHLYMQILIHHMHAHDTEDLAKASDALQSGKVDEIVIADDETHSHADTVRKGPVKKATTSSWSLPEGVEGVFEPSVAGTRLQGGQSPFQKAAHRLTVDQLSAKYMVPVRRSILSVFMTRDNTMITIAGKNCKEVLGPIYDRLEDDTSLLRRAGDVSMLAQALLDVSVDLAIEIQQTFEVEILKVEATVLVDPQMETVRHLHILSSQLIRLRRSLAPLLRVCYIVRDQEVQRSRAASAVATAPRPIDRNHGSRDTEWIAPQTGTRPGTPGPSEFGFPLETTNTLGFDFQMSRPSSQTPVSRESGGGPQTGGIAGIPTNANGMVPWKEPMAMTGFFSPMTKVYIGDVLDHLEIICSSMDQFVATCDHLTDYVFNVLSFQTNASMERLSVVTVIFLPLTFISSYFGMNFEDFGALQNSVSYFWKVAAPCTAAFFVIFSFSYIQYGFSTIMRRFDRWRRTREVAEKMHVERKERRRRKSVW